MNELSSLTGRVIDPTLDKVASRAEMFRAQLGAGFAGDVPAAGPLEKANIDALKEGILTSMDQAANDFKAVLAPMRQRVQVMTGILFIGLAISVVLGAFSIVSPYVRVPVSVATIVGLFPLIQRTWQLSRDQAQLELTPAIYRVAFASCSSPEQFQKVLESWLNAIRALKRDG
jgi:hypothetical protein